jgi:hypothetical protein
MANGRTQRPTEESRAIQQSLATIMQVRHRTPPGPKEMAVWLHALEGYPTPMILRALSLHTRRSKSAPVPANIIEILDALDGRPGAQQAWANCQRAENEDATIVWTQEEAQAWGVALPLIQAGDRIAARMAFLERYNALVDEARERRSPARWIPSLGRDPAQRADVITQAVEQGRIASEAAQKYLPAQCPPGALNTLALSAPDARTRAHLCSLARKFIPQLRERLAGKRPLAGGRPPLAGQRPDGRGANRPEPADTHEGPRPGGA